MIKLDNLSLQRGKKILLEDTSLTIHAKQKWGVIGENGAGKSSLFKLFMGAIHEDAGQFFIPSDWKVSHLAQETPASAENALDYVIDGDAELRKIESQLAHAIEQDNSPEMADLYQKLEEIDGYQANVRAEKLLFGLGFKPGDSIKPVSSFSGGWRIRLNLAQALMCRSDLLLLDEPTNHLDLDATVWLERWLKYYTGTLIVISHDRDFLDNVIDHIANISQQTIATYTGNYESFERQKAEKLALQGAAFEKQQTEIAHIESFIRRFKAKATKAKQAQSRIKALERMEKIAPAYVSSPFHFEFPEPEKVPDSLITLDNVQAGYNNTVQLQKLNQNILGESRVALLGHNGAGKSTFLKTIAGIIPALNGEINQHDDLKIGYFAQHQLELLDNHASCYDHLQRKQPKATEQAIRNFLGGFNFQGDRVFESIEHFSGGEKARLALALVAWDKPNLLLLDEPTNHLDIEMRQALTMAIQSFQGALILISHDRHLIRNTIDHFWIVANGSVKEYEGDLNDYQNELNQVDKQVQPAAQSSGPVIDKNALRKEQKTLNNLVKKLEKEIQKTNQEKEKLDTLLGDPTQYDGYKGGVDQLVKDQQNSQNKLDMLEEEWLDASEKLESLQ